jgi:predicted cobalt transporter CbtA
MDQWWHCQDSPSPSESKRQWAVASHIRNLIMKPAWLLLIVGIACLVISFGIVLVSILLPIFNAPRIDFEEVLPALIGGGCCSAVSLAIVLVGILWLVLGGRRWRGRPGSRGLAGQNLDPSKRHFT